MKTLQELVEEIIRRERVLAPYAQDIESLEIQIDEIKKEAK